MPKLPPPRKSKLKEWEQDLACVACGGTGQASKGGKCVPCNGKGRKLYDPSITDHRSIVNSFLGGKRGKTR